jgi:hypothetical protein
LRQRHYRWYMVDDGMGVIASVYACHSSMLLVLLDVHVTRMDLAGYILSSLSLALDYSRGGPVVTSD